MEDDFEKLIEMLSEKGQAKEKKLDEIFRRTSHFFEEYKEVQLSGNEKEKEDIQKKMNLLRVKIKEEKERSAKEANLSDKDIEKAIENRGQFTKEQWEFLQKTKEQLSAVKEDKKKIEEEEKKERLARLKSSKKKKPTSKKSGWLKS